MSIHPIKRLLEAEIFFVFKEELQRENKLISSEGKFKMLENDMYIAEIGPASSRALKSYQGITLVLEFSKIFGNMRLVSPKMTSHLTSHNFQLLKIEIFSIPCKI